MIIYDKNKGFLYNTCLKSVEMKCVYDIMSICKGKNNIL